jgi:isopenicillin-N epimerase
MHAPPAALGPDLARLWPLDPACTFLNHGSFGSVPLEVAEAQEAHRRLIESRPIEWLGRRHRELLAPARSAASAFLGADPEGLGFVTNATEGVNAVLSSFECGPGDELLTTSHVYNAVHQAMKVKARRTGAAVRIVDLDPPFDDAGELVDHVVAAIGPRTRLLIIDHITSPTGLVFPAVEVVREARRRGVAVLVDGAHGPGMLDLSIDALGADWYTGNLHKWCCAPKGCAFLWTSAERRAATHPAVVSHHLDEGYTREFDWQGTRDLTPWMTAADAIAWLDRRFGWPALRAHNRDLARWAHAMLLDRFGSEGLSPRDGSWLGSLATVPLPARLAASATPADRIQAELSVRHDIEVPIIDWRGRKMVRVSAQAYNRPEQYLRLADALLELEAEA